MARNPDERIEILERRVNTYRVLVLLMLVLLVVIQRNRIVGWLDRMEHWVGTMASTSN
jgi:hypothetical protein